MGRCIRVSSGLSLVLTPACRLPCRTAENFRALCTGMSACLPADPVSSAVFSRSCVWRAVPSGPTKLQSTSIVALCISLRQFEPEWERYVFVQERRVWASLASPSTSRAQPSTGSSPTSWCVWHCIKAPINVDHVLLERLGLTL